MVTVTNVRDNQSIPLAAEYTYLPDQLVFDLKNAVTSTITVAGGPAVLQRGTVLGMMTSGAAGLVGTPVAASGNSGDPVISAISFGEQAIKGNYVVHFTAATTYVVTNPNGEVLAPSGPGPGHFGAKSGVSEIAFTFTAGTNAAVSGDEVVIVAVSGGATVWGVSKASHTDGTQVPRGILADICDPTSGPVTAPVYVAGEFNANALIFDASWTLAELTGVMSAGIYLKTPLTASDPIGEIGD